MVRVKTFHVEMGQEIIERALAVYEISTIFPLHDIRFFPKFRQVSDQGFQNIL